MQLSNMQETSYSFSPVGIVKSCYKAKFGIPRQPGLIEEARGFIRILPPYNQPNIVRGLEAFSHVWILFVFHEAMREGWKATVRPPRLGGDARLGVFATRSPFRPCPIGLSAVKLEKIEIGGHGKLLLHVSGLDLVDGTPVLDIKPYLPYTDAVQDATGGFAQEAPDSTAIATEIAPEAEKAFAQLAARGYKHLKALALKVVSADPRPAYQREPGREYSVFLEDFEIVWRISDNGETALIADVRKPVVFFPAERRRNSQK